MSIWFMYNIYFPMFCGVTTAAAWLIIERAVQ